MTSRSGLPLGPLQPAAPQTCRLGIFHPKTLITRNYILQSYQRVNLFFVPRSYQRVNLFFVPRSYQRVNLFFVLCSLFQDPTSESICSLFQDPTSESITTLFFINRSLFQDPTSESNRSIFSVPLIKGTFRPGIFFILKCTITRTPTRARPYVYINSLVITFILAGIHYFIYF